MIFRRSLVLFLLLAAAALATIQYWIPAFIYRPTPLKRPEPQSWGLNGATLIRARYGDGTVVTGWWSPPAGPNSPVVLIVHGRSANIASRASIMKRLMADGMGVLMFDFRGYGASTGTPSERHLTEDTLTAYQWMRSKGVSPDKIVVIGQSLGDSPAAALAASRPIGALLLVSPFTNMPDALAQRLPWLPIRILPWTRNRFDVDGNVKQFKGPTLLIVSETDGMVPLDNAKRLRNSAPGSKWLDTSPLRHDGMLQAIANDGRLTKAIDSMIRPERPSRHDSAQEPTGR